MQTFLPYSNYRQSAETLDRQRLGKQRVETLQILRALRGLSPGKGWINHPAVKMWRGCEESLGWYGIIICRVWKERGYQDTCLDKIRDLMHDVPEQTPWWLGLDAFHRSHRSMLLQKNPNHYGQYFKEPELAYWWPE